MALSQVTIYLWKDAKIVDRHISVMSPGKKFTFRGFNFESQRSFRFNNFFEIFQYGRRDNVRIFGVEEAPNEDVYQAVIDVAEKAGCQVSRPDISICHRVPSRNVKPGQGRPIISKFVRRQTKIGLMTNKKKLKDSENKIYINDDLTLLRARLAKALRQRQDVTAVNMINEKIVGYQQNDTKTVFDSLFKLYEWDPDFVYSVCKSSLHFC